jgi:methionyl-tRNA formyltransferase
MTLRIAFAGTPEVAIPSLQALLDAGHDVDAVITRPDAPAGRGRIRTPSPVAAFAESRGLRVLKPAKLADIADELRRIAPACIPVVAYGGLVPAEMLGIPERGWINLHFSLLPQWRGAAPVQRAIMAGDDVTGASTFRIDAGLDTGPVFGTLTRTIAGDDTAGSLLDALAHDGASLLVQTVANIATLRPVPQSTDDVSHADKLEKADAEIVWSHPAISIDRRIRGCTPEPGAWSSIMGDRIEIGPVGLRPDVTELAAGAFSIGKQVLAGTGSHAVELRQVKPAGKGWMAADAWARGLRTVPERFDAR